MSEIWIMPIISEDDKVLSLFPFFGYRYIGSPFGIGLRAVDYDNNHGCTKMEIHKLALKSKNSSFEVIKGSTDPIVVEFEKYLSDIDHVHAKLLIPAGDWLDKRNKEAVTFQAKFKIYTNNGIVEDDIEVTYNLQSISRFSIFYEMGH